MHSVALAPHERKAPAPKAATEEERRQRAKAAKHEAEASRPTTKFARSVGEESVAGIIAGHTIQDVSHRRTDL